MRLLIPSVGTEIRLEKSIMVELKDAGQNKRFVDSLSSKNRNGERKTKVRLPKGLTLCVDRVYIRKGDNSLFDSLTFSTEGYASGSIPKGRFFLPVETANKFDITLLKKKKEHRKNYFRTLFLDLKNEASIESILNDSFADEFMEKINSSDIIEKGILAVEVEKEYETIKDSLNDCLKKMSISDIESMQSMIRSKMTEESKFHLDGFILEIKKLEQLIEKFLTENKYIELYKFSLLKSNGDIALKIEIKQNEIREALIDLGEAYDFFIKKYKSLIPDKKHFRVELYSLGSHLRRPMEETDSFGFYYSKSSPKTVLRNSDNTIGLIPMDAFPDNLLTRTRNVYGGHEFHYLTENGIDMSVSQFRSLAKKHS